MMSSGKLWCTVLLSILAAHSPVQAQDKPAAPSSEEQVAAEKVIKDIFKAEYAKRGAADRQALAKKLISQGIDTKDDLNSQFVLLREARDLAAQGGDPTMAMAAIDEIVKQFQVDQGSMRFATLTMAAKAVRTAEEFKALTLATMAAIDSAIASDEFEAADRLAGPVVQYAKKTQDMTLASHALAKTREITEAKSRAEKVRKAKETLAADPEDAASNLVVGRFLCINKGEWERGLPLLAKASDPALASLAQKDLAGPAEAELQVTLGDGWWDLAEKEASPAKERLRERAGQWYGKAFNSLSGLSKTRVEKRLVECHVAGVLRGTWMDVTDAKLFNLQGKPGDPIELATSPGKITTIKMQFPKGEFDGLTARLTLDPARDCSAFMIYEGPRGSALLVDTPRGFFANAKGAANGWNLDYTDFWTKDAETVMTILVAGGEYILYLNGQEKTRVKTTRTRIEYVGFEARNATVKFDQIKLRRAD